jgi:hypothetical protein
VRTKPKTPFAGGLRKRWKLAEGGFGDWDYQHGEVEVYNDRANIRERSIRKPEPRSKAGGRRQPDQLYNTTMCILCAMLIAV